MGTIRRRVGVFGGTFDPLHLGHLRSAEEVRARLGLDEIRLIPCHLPPHRQAPDSDAGHRLAMVRLAVASCPGLEVDALELERDEPSYTVDTLRILRRQLGEDTALSLLLGTDAFNTLDRWREWRRLLELANLIVMRRPETPLSPSPELAEVVAGHEVDRVQWAERLSGGILFVELQPWPISATGIRERIAGGEDAAELLPEPVWDYVRRHGLYGHAAS